MSAARVIPVATGRPTLVERAARRLVEAETSASVQDLPRHTQARRPQEGTARRVAINRSGLIAAGMAVPGHSRSQLAEEIRALRVALAPRLAQARDWRERVLLVTSARPREGKTFTAVSLALGFAAEPDRRVLLIDLDPARFGASRLLGVPPAPGLADLLADPPADPAEVFLRTDLGSLSFVPPGACGDDFPDRLGSRRTAAVLAGMLQSDPGLVVVVDAPPVLAGTEALSLLGCVGTVLFVVEAGRTPKRDVERALAPIRGRAEIALILNKAAADVSLGHYYAAYYGPKAQAERRGFWRRLFGRRRSALMLAAAIAIPPLVAAARLDLIPRLELATAFTDNVSFAPKGEAEPALIGAATLGLAVNGETSRSRLAADYAVSRFATLVGEGGAELRQKLDGAMRAELVQELVFVDANASIGQETTTTGDGAGLPEFAISEERVTRYAGTISPFVRRRLGDALEAELRARLGRVDYDDPVLTDATTLGAGLVVGAPRRRALFGWAATARVDRIDIEPSRVDPARIVDSRALLLDGELSPIDGLILLFGVGWSELQDETLADGKARGPYLRLGGMLETAAGVRFDGTVGLLYGEPDLNAGVGVTLGPSTTLEARYRQRLVNRVTLIGEEITARNPIERLGRSTALADPDFRALVPEIDLDLGTSASFEQQLGELVLQRERGRNLVRTSLYAERRRFEVAAEADEWRYGVEFGWLRRMTPRSNLQLLAEAQRIDFDRGERLDELSVEVGWTHQLSRQTRIGIGYELALRDGAGADDVVANTVFARLIRTF